MFRKLLYIFSALTVTGCGSPGNAETKVKDGEKTEIVAGNNQTGTEQRPEAIHDSAGKNVSTRGDSIAGAWHAAPSVGSGYLGRYLFLPDHHYIYFESQSEDTGVKRIAEAGTWMTEHDSLVITVKKIYYTVDGNPKRTATSAEYKYYLGPSEKENPENSPYTFKMKIDGNYFWKCSDADEASWITEFREISREKNDVDEKPVL